MATVLTPATYHTELIDGQEIEKPVPKNQHAFAQTYLIQWFGRELSPKYRVASELNVWCGPDRPHPRHNRVAGAIRRFVEGDLADPAQLAIEILSSAQTIGSLFDKADRIVKAGTPMCWVIWPERRQVWQYESEQLTEANEQLFAPLSGSDSVAVSLPELWKELD